uniref:Uncharacterized protein n=1 Tax=Biomphalaria glabrata TaxID=6526 RepID=A0A2C9L2E2_BIOGL
MALYFGIELIKKEGKFFVLAGIGVTVIILLQLSSYQNKNTHVESWLEANKLGHLKDFILQTGGPSLADTLEVLYNARSDCHILSSLHPNDKQLLMGAVNRLHDQLELELWLTQNNLSDVIELLQKDNIVSLKEFSQMKVADVSHLLNKYKTDDKEKLIQKWSMLKEMLSSGSKVIDNRDLIDYVRGKSKLTLTSICKYL